MIRREENPNRRIKWRVDFYNGPHNFQWLSHVIHPALTPKTYGIHMHSGSVYPPMLTVLCWQSSGAYKLKCWSKRHSNGLIVRRAHRSIGQFIWCVQNELTALCLGSCRRRSIIWSSAVSPEWCIICPACTNRNSAFSVAETLNAVRSSVWPSYIGVSSGVHCIIQPCSKWFASSLDLVSFASMDLFELPSEVFD